MKASWLNVGGAWKEATDVWVKTGGVWKSKVVPKGYIGTTLKDFKSYSTIPPVTPTGGIVKNGLTAYWNYKQGVSGGKWNNIAPSTLGKHNMDITGAINRADGMYFDGVDDVAKTTGFTYTIPKDFTIEVISTYISWKSAFKSVFFLSGLDDYGDFLPLIVWLDYTQLMPGLPEGFPFGGIDIKTGYPFIVPYTMVPNKPLHIQATISYSTGKANLFINNELLATSPTQDFSGTPVNLATGQVETLGAETVTKSMRLYNRILTDEELLQNYQNGENVGL